MKDEANIISIIPKERIKLSELIPWASNGLVEFVGKMLALDPSKRTTIADV